MDSKPRFAASQRLAEIAEERRRLEVAEAAEAVREAATDDTNIIFGATIDDRLEGQMWITVVATGIGRAGKRSFISAGGPGDLETPAFLRDV